ncbi:MAG: glycoside hydrolase family protein [Opitutaceae bacterium]
MKKHIIMTLMVCAFTASCVSNAKDSEKTGNPIHDKLGVVPVDGGFKQEGYWVWGSSIVKGDDGKYHMYVSRWPKTLKFHPGWMVASEIVHAVSDDPLGPYEFSDVALGKRHPQYWDGCSQHNPKVFKHGDTYILYYMGSTHPFEDAVEHPEEVVLNSKYSIVGRSNKRIGVATSKSPYGPWKRMDAPVLDTKPDTFYSFLTSNPTPVIHEDGSVLLIFKSRTHNKQFPYHTDMMLGVAKAPHYTGPYTVAMDEPIFSETRFGVVEDPYLWLDDEGYHMLAKDQHGKIAKGGQGGILAHSQNGLDWVVDEDPIAYTKDIKWSDGKTVTMGQLERVQGVVEDGKLTHLSFAVMDGPGGFHNGKNTWNIVVPIESE